jgi:hypothetical protein
MQDLLQISNGQNERCFENDTADQPTLRQITRSYFILSSKIFTDFLRLNPIKEQRETFANVLMRFRWQI